MPVQDLKLEEYRANFANGGYEMMSGEYAL